MIKIKNIILVTIVSILTIVTTPAPAAAWFAYSPEWEQVNRDNFYQQTISEIGLNRDEEAQQALRNQADIILLEMGEDPANYRIALTRQPGYSAFAGPGKNVYVSPALYNSFTYSERCAVLAHEFTHARDLHVIKKMDEAAETKFMGTAIFDIFAKGKSYQSQQQLSFGLTVLRNQYLKGGLGRDQENFADQVASDTILKMAEEHKLNAGGAAATFARLKLLFDNGSTAGAMGFLTSLVNPDEHSSNQARLDKALSRLKDFSNGRVEVKNDVEIWVDNQFLAKAGYASIGGRETPATVNVCLIAGKLAGLAHDNNLPTDRTALLKLFNKYKE